MTTTEIKETLYWAKVLNLDPIELQASKQAFEQEFNTNITNHSLGKYIPNNSLFQQEITEDSNDNWFGDL
jgi:hypothetical protein